MARRKKRYTRKKVAKAAFGMAKWLGPMIYGALRTPLSNYIGNTQLGQSIKAVKYGDEALMYLLATLGGKMGLGKRGIGRAVVQSAKTIEKARVGAQLADDLLAGTMFGSGNTSGQTGGTLW